MFIYHFSSAFEIAAYFRAAFLLEREVFRGALIFYLNYHSDCFGLRKDIFDQGLYTQDNEILLLSQIQNEDLVIEKYSKAKTA